MKKFAYVLSCLLFLTVISRAGLVEFNTDMVSKVPYKSAIYTQRTTLNYSDKKSYSDNKIWIKDGKIRTELVNDDGKITDVTILKDGYIYKSYGNSKEGTMAGIGPDNKTISIMVEDTARKNAVKTGEEKVNGVKCSVYEYVNTLRILYTESKTKITEYRNSDGFPMKTVSRSADDENDRPVVTEVLKLEKNPLISDSVFAPLKGIVYKDLTDQMKSMAGLGQEVSEAMGLTKTAKKSTDTMDTKLENNISEAESDDVSEKTNENENKTEENIFNKTVEGAAGAVLKGIFGQ